VGWEWSRRKMGLRTLGDDREAARRYTSPKKRESEARRIRRITVSEYEEFPTPMGGARLGKQTNH